MPPSSWTWNVKAVEPAPPVDVTEYCSSLASMSATETNCPAVTATPLSVRLPMAGKVVILTARKLSGGESKESLKPKSDVENVYGVPCAGVTVFDVPVGA